MTDDQLLRLCARHDELSIEREPNGDFTLMTPTAIDSGNNNARRTTALKLWADEDDRGIVLDSSTGVTLPDNSVQSADAAWVSNCKLNAFTPDHRKRFARVCPEFMIERHAKVARLREKL